MSHHPLEVKVEGERNLLTRKCTLGNIAEVVVIIPSVLITTGKHLAHALCFKWQGERRGVTGACKLTEEQSQTEQ